MGEAVHSRHKLSQGKTTLKKKQRIGHFGLEEKSKKGFDP